MHLKQIIIKRKDVKYCYTVNQCYCFSFYVSKFKLHILIWNENTNGNKIMDKKCSFANIYGIDPADYVEVKTENANFSVRTFGRLRANKIYTIGELLKRDEADLFSIKGFGKNCYSEVLKYIESLPNSLAVNDFGMMTLGKQPGWAKENRDLLYEGKFSDLDSEYLEKDKEYIERMQEAYVMLDRKLINDIRENSPMVFEYAHYFRSFYLEMEKIIKQRKEIENCLIYLAEQKPNKYVYPYIMAYSNDTVIRKNLLSLWDDEKSEFYDLRIYQLKDFEFGLMVLKFLQWCCFDVKNEYLGYLSRQKDWHRIEDILRRRSQHNTLEEVGNIYGITR